MTFQDLGSIGEVVGAIATLGTLLYLAIQIRANTQAMKSEARRSHYAIGRDNNSLIIEHGDVAELMQRGLADPRALDPVERSRLEFLLASFVNNAELGFFELEQGVIDDEEVERTLAGTGTLLNTPGGRKFWKRRRKLYRKAFAERLDALIEPVTPVQSTPADESPEPAEPVDESFRLGSVSNKQGHGSGSAGR